MRLKLCIVAIMLILSVQQAGAVAKLYRTFVDSETHYVGESGWFGFQVTCFYCDSPDSTIVRVNILDPSLNAIYEKEYNVVAYPGNSTLVRIPCTFETTGYYKMKAYDVENGIEMGARIKVLAQNPITATVQDFTVKSKRLGSSVEVYVTPTIVASSGDPTTLRTIVKAGGYRMHYDHAFQPNEHFTKTFTIRMFELENPVQICVMVKYLFPYSGKIDEKCKLVNLPEVPSPPTPPTPPTPPSQALPEMPEVSQDAMVALLGVLGILASAILYFRPF